MRLLKILLTSLTVVASLAWSQVNINTANMAELSALSGIGEKKAQAIIEYRNSHGKFESIDELTSVKGIGEKTLKKLSSDIILKGETDLDKISKKSKSTKKKTTKVKKTVKKNKAEPTVNKQTEKSIQDATQSEEGVNVESTEVEQEPKSE